MKDTVVIGLGNTLMSDEGIGVCIIRQLEDSGAAAPFADLVEMGTGGIRLLHAFEGYRKAILADCARMGIEAGGIRRFTPDEVTSSKKLAGFSLHEGDLLTTIGLASDMGSCPEEIVILGIEPERVEHGEGLSDSLSAHMDEYIEAVLKELR